MAFNALLLKSYLGLLLFVPLLNGMQQFNASNFLDQSFENNGIIITDFGMHSATYKRYAESIHIKVQPDKKILVVGDAYHNHIYPFDHPESSFALVRYNSHGNLDNSFGVGGKVIFHLSELDSYGIDLAL